MGRVISLPLVFLPIRILVENDDVKSIEGKPHVPVIEEALAPKAPQG